MEIFDYGSILPFLIALFFWIRGLLKRSRSDLIASGVAFCIATGIYVYLSKFIVLSGLPWISLLIAAFCSAILLIRNKNRTGVLRMATVVVLCLSAVLFLAEQKWSSSSNSLLVISPYRSAGTWVFDDASVGLQAEPFVSGIPELIDKLVADANIPDANQGFRLIFSAQPFPNHQMEITWLRREFAGNWYYSKQYDMEGWLCPALFKYFRRAPKIIYLKAEAK